MRFMILMKASDDSEAGVMPSESLIAEMTSFNEEMTRAGVLLAGEGLHPSSNGTRVHYEGGRKTVIDGPFAETKELIAGFWLIEAQSYEEALEWTKRVPNPDNADGDIELRQVFSVDDFGEEATPELREREQRMREQNAERAAYQ